jgi:hypothetical protein
MEFFSPQFRFFRNFVFGGKKSFLGAVEGGNEKNRWQKTWDAVDEAKMSDQDFFVSFFAVRKFRKQRQTFE